jgi:hypothetical protein
MVKSGYEGYFGLIGAIGLSALTLCWSRSDPARKVLIGVCIGIFVGVIQMLFPIYLGDLQPSSLWQIRDPIVASGVIGIGVALVTLNQSINSFQKFGLIGKILVVAMALNVAYVPVLIYSHFVEEGTQKYAYLNQVSQSSGKWKTILKESGVQTGDRIYLAEPTLFREADWHGYRNFAQFSGIGVASINSWPKIRDARTLNFEKNGGETKFLNIVDSSHGCKPEEMQFLNVSHVLVRNNECKNEYDRIFGASGYVRKALSSPTGGEITDQIWLYSLKVFPRAYFGSKDQPSVSNCAMLSENSCVSKLGIIPSAIQVSSPAFQLCETGCIGRLSISDSETGATIVLPIDFDKSIRIKSEKTGRYLKTESYKGLLSATTDKVKIGNDQLRISISPDFRMKINAASPWAHIFLLFAIVALCGSSFVKKTLISMTDKQRDKN